VRISISDPAPPTTVASEPPPSASPPSIGAGPSPFAQLLRNLGREIDAGETAMRTGVQSMRAGANLGPQGLIALQIGVYRYSEAIDLVSRVVDRAVSGVKTVVQGGGP
jgi:hypothetical protein